ncbi:MAG: OmpA family protein, partial [Bacteroidaceae bacterium]|nr:OmpA family protein [Bacteroidaceae bacterium]
AWNGIGENLQSRIIFFKAGQKNMLAGNVYIRNTDYLLFVTALMIFLATGVYTAEYRANVGVTYYFKDRGWRRTVWNTTYFVEDQTTINRLNDEINKLKQELAQAQAAPVVAAVPIATSKTITFPYLVNFVIDKVKVVNRERVNLGVVAEMIKATPEQKYLICGYADKHTGSVERNIWLAEHRAKNVFKILTKEFGVPAEQLILDDKGGVENMFYDDPQLSRSAIISKYNEKKTEE